jgi:hypothetical protein
VAETLRSNGIPYTRPPCGCWNPQACAGVGTQCGKPWSEEDARRERAADSSTQNSNYHAKTEDTR